MMESDVKNGLATPLTISLVLHGVILAILMGSWFDGSSLLSKKASKPAQPEPKITQATTVKQEDLKRELARLDDIDKKKDQQRRAQEEKARKLKQQRIAEEKRLQKLKADQAAAAKKAEQALKEKQQRLADLEAKRKAAEKKQKEIEQKAAAAEKKRVAEEKARVEAEKQRVAEEKRQAELKAAQAKREAEEKAKQEKLAQEEKARQDAAMKAAARKKEQQISAQIQTFGFRVRQKVAQNWLVQGRKEGASCVLRVQLAPGGMVLDVNIQESSGDQAFDRSAIAAVYKSSPLPVPSDPEAFERMRELRLTLRPEDVLTAG